MTQGQLKRRTARAWEKYRKAISHIPSNDPSYPAIERRAWIDLQVELLALK